MSRRPGPTQASLTSSAIPATTPGILGRLDAGDPSVHAEPGDTPGSVGHGDHAVPRRKHHADARKHTRHLSRHPATSPHRQSVLQAKIHRRFDQEQGHSFAVVVDARRNLLRVEDREQVVAIVYFATDDSTLSMDDMAALQKVYDGYEALLFKPHVCRYEVVFKIEGFADYRGSEKHNTKLSQQRADAVAAFFEPLTASANFERHIKGMPMEHPQTVRRSGGPVSRQLNPFRRVDLKARPVLTWFELPPPEEKVPEKKIVKPPVKCRLMVVRVACEHTDSGERVATSGRLEVVPTPVADRLSLTAEIEHNCGAHPQWTMESVRVVGLNQHLSVTAPKPHGFWLPSIKPRSYTVDCASCAGSGGSVRIDAYPPDQFSASYDFTKGIWEKLKKIQDKVDKWAETLIDHFKFTLPAGSVSVQAGWKEHTDYRAFYAYSIGVVFEPLFGGEFKFELSPLKIAKIASKLPGIGRYFEKIVSWLVKAGVYFSANGGVDFDFGWKRESADQKEYSGRWGKGVKGRVSLELGAEASVFGGEVLSVEFKAPGSITAGGNPRLGAAGIGIEEFRLMFEGLKGAATIKLLHGTIHWTDAVTFVEPTTLYGPTEFWIYHPGDQ